MSHVGYTRIQAISHRPQVHCFYCLPGLSFYRECATGKLSFQQKIWMRLQWQWTGDIIAINNIIIEAFIVHALWYRWACERSKTKRDWRRRVSSLLPQIMTTHIQRGVRTANTHRTACSSFNIPTERLRAS